MSVRDRSVMIRAPALGGPEVKSASKGIVRDDTDGLYLDEQGVLQRFDADVVPQSIPPHKSLYRLDIDDGYVVDVVKKTLMTVSDTEVVCGLHRLVTLEDCGNTG